MLSLIFTNNNRTIIAQNIFLFRRENFTFVSVLFNKLLVGTSWKVNDITTTAADKHDEPIFTLFFLITH